MTIGIVANQHRDIGLAYTQKVSTFLMSRGVEIAPEGEKADFWVVLGGDGTMLRAAHQAALLDVPMLGINLGNMGFLTDVDKEEGLCALEKVLSGEYKSHKRLMLEVKSDNKKSSWPLALNEAFIRSKTGGLVYYSVYVNHVHMDDIRADGIIVATPTGSTAYSLSAGGPILAPYGDMVVITAVCPHSLSTRPWVVSADDMIRIVPQSVGALVLDGDNITTVDAGCGIEIGRAAVCATIIKTADVHFYEVLRRKKLL